MLLSEEEKKKKEEEAKSIINMNNIGETINSINYANLKNRKIETQNENEQTFINRVNEANDIINSINPRKNIEAPSVSEEDKAESLANTQSFLALIKSNNDTNIQTNNSNNFQVQEQEIQEESLKNNINLNEDEIRETAKKMKTQNISLNNDQENKKITNKKINSTIMNPNNIQNEQEVTMSDIKATEEADKKNKNLEKGGLEAFNEWADTIFNSISGGVKKAAAGLANVVTTLTALGLRGLEGASRIVGLEKVSDNINSAYNSVVKAGSDIKEIADYTSNVTSKIDDDFTKTSGQVVDVVSNMAANAFIGYVTGVPSTAIQGITVGGSSAQEVLDENKENISQATISGIAKGYTSYLTEKMFDANILTRGEESSISKGIDKIISKNLQSKFGKEFANRTVGILGENIEELVEDNVDNLIDKVVNDKATPDFLSKEWWDNTNETAKITTLSTIIMGFLGLGGETFENKEKDMQADYWIKQAQEIIEQENMAIHYNPNEIKNISDTEPFYITRFSEDGQLENIVPTRGKIIENPNKELNVIPVVVKDSNTKYYNIIDGNTGVVLDSTYYENTLEAENSFSDKVNNLTEIQLKDINKKIAESNYTITNEIMDSINQAREQLLKDNNINNQNVNMKNNNIKSFNDIKKLNEQISDKSIYNNTAAINVFKTVSNNIKNIEVSKESGTTFVNSLNKNGEITYQQKISSPLYNGAKIKTIINNAITNADLSDINISDNTNIDNTHTTINQNTDNLNSNETSYTPEKVKSIVEPFSVQEEYTVEEMTNIWNNEIDKEDLQSIYDDKGNLQGYVSIQEDGNKLVVNNYDSNDNIISSKVIPSQNGKYTSKVIKDTIEKVTGLYDQNKAFEMKKQKITNKKYSNATDLLKDKQAEAEKSFNPAASVNAISELKEINFNKISENEYIKLSKNVFKKYNTKRTFYNNNSKLQIKVILADIKESAYKAFNNKYQNKLIKQHIEALTKIEDIISNAEEVSMESEKKNRKKYSDWKYFTTQMEIENKPYLIQFDIAKQDDGYHFRLQRLVELNIKNTRDTASTMTNKQVGVDSRQYLYY